MTTYGEERFAREVEECRAQGLAHFCTCDDVECPLNPNNPKSRELARGCDGCIRKNLALGEIPSCFFNKVGPTDEDWDDYSIAGFVRHCRARGISGD